MTLVNIIAILLLRACAPVLEITEKQERNMTNYPPQLQAKITLK